MSLIKAKIEQDDVSGFLNQKFNSDISGLTFIKGGELSQAFSFTSQDKNYIFRVNKTDESFIKDQYASIHFSSEIVPIPKVLNIGKMNEDLHYCITEKADGHDLGTVSEGFRHVVYPKLIKILDAIHATKLASGKYGWWVDDAEAVYATWKEYIVTNGYYLRGQYESTILEKEIIERVFGEIEKLSSYLPEERHLIHGDFGGNNAIFDGKNITGIIDWGNSAFGDFLFDAANQEYWVGKNMAYDVYCEHYKQKGWNIENFKERIQCYLLYIGAGVMGFYAEADMKDHYEMSKRRLLELLG